MTKLCIIKYINSKRRCICENLSLFIFTIDSRGEKFGISIDERRPQRDDTHRWKIYLSYITVSYLRQ